MAVISFTASEENDVHLAVNAFGRDLQNALANEFSDVKLIVFGPFEAGIYKIAGRYRMRYVLKCKNNPATRRLIAQLYSGFLEKSSGSVSISVDMDPQSM